MNRREAALALPACLAFLLHLPARACGFVFDDRGVIVDNPLMQDLARLPRLLASPWWVGRVQDAGLWRPLTSLTFALDRAVAGLEPAWFHLVNVGWHAVVTGLLTLLALDLGAGVAGALLAGGLFAVHPVHTEAVVGIVGRAELIAAAAVLGALLLHRRALRGAGGGAAAILAPLCVVAAMLAKESGFAVIALVAIVERLPGRTTPAPIDARRRRALWIAYAAVILLVFGLRWAVLGRPGPGATIPFVDNPAASAGAVTGRLTALACVVRYTRLLLWPRVLSADYSYDQIPIAGGIADAGVILGFLLAAGALVLGWRLRRRLPLVGFGLLLLAVALAPASNLIVFAGTLLAERLLYLPSAGLALLVAGIAAAVPAGALRGAAYAASILL
ncbi:MAG TPA: DUF1736 domain-containing protein, partial [Candidatus Polarisedimenticolia bacterium]|nr:DUF1736 domain-containing protein [Candidatus Polarisedimenticolia bacterium]